MSMAIVGGVVVAGTAAYGAYNSKQQADAQADAARKAGQRDIGTDIRSYVSGYSDSLPDVLGLEGKYRGKFQNLNQDEIRSFLGWPNGLFGLSNMSQDRAGNLLGDSRRSDINQYRDQAKDIRGLMHDLSPKGANQVKQASQMARDARQAAKGLTGQEARSAEQFARESSADRGRVMDNSSIFAEGLNRDELLGQKRAEASQMTSNAFNMAQSFYQQPGLQQLNQTPQSYQAGQGLLGIGLSSIGSSTPQLINPDVGVNIGAADRQNQLGAASAAAQAAAARNASYLNAGTSMFNSYMNYQANQQ